MSGRSARDLQRGNRRYKESIEIAESALSSLSKAGLGSIIVVQTGGRPRTDFTLHSSESVDIDESPDSTCETDLPSTDADAETDFGLGEPYLVAEDIERLGNWG